MSTIAQNQYVRNTAIKPRMSIAMRWIYQIGFALIGVLAGRIVLLEEIAVGGLGYIVATSSTPYFFMSFVGSIVGRLSMSTDQSVPIEIIPEVLCFTILFVLKKIKYLPEYRAAVLIAIIARLPILFVDDISYLEMIMFAISTTILVGSGYFFSKSIDAVFTKNIKPNIVMIVGAFSLLLSGLPPVETGQIQLMMIVSSIVIIACASSLGAAHASGVAAVLALSIALSGENNIELGGMLVLCALIAGMFAQYGKYIVSVIYTASCVSISLLYSRDIYYMMSWQSLAIGLVCGLLLPSSWIFRLTKQIDMKEKINKWRSIDGTSKSILELSKCLDVLKNVFNDVSATEIMQMNDNSQLLQEINVRSCKGCEKESLCWEKDIYNTYRVLGKVVADWDENTAPDVSIIHESSLKQCNRINKLVQAVNETYNLYKMQTLVAKRVVESKQLISSHLTGGALILKEMSSEISQNYLTDNEKVYRALSSFTNIVYPINETRGHYSIKCKSCGNMGNCKMIAKKISEVTQKKHVVETRHCGTLATNCSVSIAPVMELEVYYSVAQKNKPGHVCGDAFAMTQLASGSHMIAIADGMGSGARANLEAKSALELLRQFLNTGFDENTVFNIINKALLLRSGTEVFAALDACIINPVDKQYRFLKVGAAPSYIYRHGEFIKIQSPSIPLGILESTECACIVRDAYPGDVVILTSDGFDESSLSAEMFQSNTTMNKLPRQMMAANRAKEDDVTIITTKIKAPISYSRQKMKTDDWRMRVAN